MSMDLCYQGHDDVYCCVFNAANGNMRSFVDSVTTELKASLVAAQIEVKNCRKALERNEETADQDYLDWLFDNLQTTKSYLGKMENAMISWGTVYSGDSQMTVEMYLYILSEVMFNLPRDMQYYVRCSVRDLPGVLNHVGNATVAVL